MALKFAYIFSNFMPPKKDAKADAATPNIFRMAYGGKTGAGRGRSGS
jgi:hypothetical protein